MSYVRAHAIVQRMPNVMYKTIIRFVFANQAIREIHSTVASNCNANRMMIVPMIKHVSTMNVSIRAYYLLLAQLTPNVLDSNIKLHAVVCRATKEVHLNVANASNAILITNAPVIVHVSIIIA